jgi:DNA-binding NarL/FixJ family response regulator
MLAGANVVPSVSGSAGPIEGLAAKRRYRVILVDDHQLFLMVLHRFLSSTEGIDIVASASSSRKALTLVELHKPDLMVMSIAMRDIPGTEVARRFSGRPIAPKIILTGFHDDPLYRSAAHAAGAAGYLPKSELCDRIVPMIHSVVE